MGIAEVDFALLSSYEFTIFFVRDPRNPRVVYMSQAFDTDSPLLLYYTAFLAMAKGEIPTADHRPDIGELLDERIRIAEIHLQNAAQYRPNEYGLVFIDEVNPFIEA